MNTIEVTMTQLRQGLGELVNRAAYGGERVILVSHGAPRAVIIGIEDLTRWNRVRNRSLGPFKKDATPRPWQERISCANAYSNGRQRITSSLKASPKYCASYARSAMMRSWVCADAGLAIMQVLREPLCDLADALWADWNRQGVTVIAPILWGYEVTSVIRKSTFRKLLAPEDEQNALDAVLRLPVEQRQPADLHQRAWALCTPLQSSDRL